MKKSWLDLAWPKAGIDRSVSYQEQKPYTTPDALNVRTDGMAEFRERGGSRPGLGLALRTQLPAEIRLLTKVSVLKAFWPKNYSYFGGYQLRDILPVPGWASSPTYTQGTSYNSGSITGTWGVGVPVIDYRDVTKPYEVGVHIKPSGTTYSGTVIVYLNLESNDDDPSVDSVKIVLTLTGGTYKASWQEIISSTPGAITESFNPDTGGATWDDNPNAPGVLSVSVVPGTKQVKVYWRFRELLDFTPTSLVNQFSSVESTDDSIVATKFTTEWSVDTTASTVYDDLRRDVLVAVSNGQIYMEDTADTLSLVNTSLDVSAGVDLVAADREQLLYIADYGVSVVGSTGVIKGPDYNTISDPARNFSGIGITDDYVLEFINSNYTQNEKQQVTVSTADGGTFKLIFKGQVSSGIPYNGTAGQVQSALSALSTIDTVEVTGDDGGPWTVEFKGTHAGTKQELLTSDITGLTHTVGTPSISIVVTQPGAGGDYFLGQYTIVSVDATTITFAPPLNVAAGYENDISAVEYQIVRSAKVFDPRQSTLVSHKATTGYAPGGCRLVCLYRDRIVYAGSDLLPHVWYMSRQGDPNDWDYSQEDSAAAVAAQNSDAGQLAQPITALIPHGDECLVFGCYNSLWICRGDPGYGGTIDQLSRKIGIVGPSAWCRTPDDMIVFLSPDGLYVMPAGCAGFPTSLSRERLPDELLCLNSTRESIHMEFDTVYRGVHIFVTKRDGSESPHWWYDWETKSFWRVSLQSDHEPFALHERIAWSDCPVVLVAGRDGYIRYFDRQFQVDDGDNEIVSYCDIGPFPLDPDDYSEGILAELSGVLGDDSSTVAWEVRAGQSPQQAYNATAQSSGTWTIEGLNNSSNPRVRGASAIVRVKNSGKYRWFLERLTAEVRSLGKRRS